MKHPAGALVDGFKNFEKTARTIVRENSRRKRGQQTAAEIHSLLGSLWLEWQFGWAPLISDIDQAAAALADLIQPMSRSGIIRVSGNGSESLSNVSEGFSPAQVGGYALDFPGVRLNTTVEVREEIRVQYTGGVRMTANDGSTDFAMRSLGLELEGFAPTLYELTPWSFLLDYFSNIGDVINSLSQPTPSFVFLNKTTKITKSVIRSGSIDTSNAWNYSGGGSAGSATTSHILFSRRTQVALPMLQPELKFPPVSKKWINMFALMRFK